MYNNYIEKNYYLLILLVNDDHLLISNEILNTNILTEINDKILFFFYFQNICYLITIINISASMNYELLKLVKYFARVQ